MFTHLLTMGTYKRTATVWMGFMALLWGTFGLARLVHPGAYPGVAEPVVTSPTGIGLFAYIAAMNGFIILMLVVGNLFVRFSWFTPGLIILILQAIAIGWTAGSNAFEVPFATVGDAHSAFLRVGLLETSAYAIVTAVTLTKSCLISSTFPPKEWAETRKLSEVPWSRSDLVMLTVALVMWLGAAVNETILLS